MLGPHWLRVFVASSDGQIAGSEVVLAEHHWAFPEGYASTRHLLIALPGQGSS